MFYSQRYGRSAFCMDLTVISIVASQIHWNKSKHNTIDAKTAIYLLLVQGEINQINHCTIP